MPHDTKAKDQRFTLATHFLYSVGIWTKFTLILKTLPSGCVTTDFVSRTAVKQVQRNVLTSELSRVGSQRCSKYFFYKSNRWLYEAERSENGLNCSIFGCSVNTAGTEVPSLVAHR